MHLVVSLDLDEAVDEYYQVLKKQPISDSTRGSRIRNVKRFVNWLKTRAGDKDTCNCS